MHRTNYGAKLANPARAAIAPAGATEGQRGGFLQRLIGWGINTTFELPPGWDVKIIESNGRGYEVFQADIDTADKEIAIAIAGQVVTVEGGSAFSSADIHRAIRADIIKETADQLAYTINTQGLPSFYAERWGANMIANGACLEWDVKRPTDMQAEAQSMLTLGTAITSLRDVLATYDRRLDIDELTTRFGIPIAGDVDGDGAPDVEEEGDDTSDAIDAEEEDPLVLQ